MQGGGASLLGELARTHEEGGVEGVLALKLHATAFFGYRFVGIGRVSEEGEKGPAVAASSVDEEAKREENEQCYGANNTSHNPRCV